MEGTDPTPSNPFRVIVIGAGIVGLSISHALQLANIDHVVLEKHDRIVSVRGAALIIWPPVARIFDQFGIHEKISKITTPITKECKRWPDGRLLCYDGTMEYMRKLFKLPTIMIDRQTCVSHLYDGLPDKSRIQTNKRLERIEHTETGVRVHLADGSTEEGDMVIGADGVHSLARKLMWDYAEKFEPDSIPKKDKEVMSFGEFRGLFGVSKVPENSQLGPSDAHVTLGQDETKLLITQKGKAYWGVTFKDGFGKAEQKSRATEADIEAVVKRLADRSIAGDVTLGDVWATNIRHGLLNVEEGVLSKWHAGRIVLVGDSAHKMTADLGMGANIAIESAVYLCNILHREFASDSTRHISTPDLTAVFAEYQAGRHERAIDYVETSGKLTRMNSYQTYFDRLFWPYILKYIAPFQSAGLAESLADGPKLDYAPTRTIDEGAEGWHLGKGKKKEDKDSWSMYVVLISLVGATAAYLVSRELPVLL